ncbi:unnamed protein product [Leptidea sinapis]|uniref:CRAL-TRIO domain-containing protein n=1 Tax=Leptidea sinapis TaxID=189913 RepID=A0A5E4Q3K5_9NEOP|nr:unnamed protein product [Leptidea sinapis]
MNIRPLIPELAEIACRELNEDPKRIESDVQHIKDWISKQPHLRARTDDQWIVTFLRGCKYSLERTKEKLDLYYSFRSLAPELFRIRTTDQLFKEIIKLGVFLILPPSKSATAPRVTVIRPGRYDSDKYNIIDILAATHNLEKIVLAEDDSGVIVGRRTILDLEGVTMGHYVQMTPSLMKKMVILGQDALPVRMKGTHYINLPPGFETIFNAMRSLLNEKNKSRVYYWLNKVEENSSWFEKEVQYGTDESKRPGKPKNAADMFGVEGSFRKLEVD